MGKLEFGMSSIGFQDLTEEDFKSMAAAGVKKLEISVAFEKYPHLDYDRIKKMSAEYGIDLWSFHLPFAGVEISNIASPDKDIRQAAVLSHSEYIKKASNIGINVFVVHPSAEPNKDEEREEIIECASESLAILAETAAKEGSVIAVENLLRTCLGRDSSEMKKLLSADDRLKVCFDTNHILLQPIKDFILDLGDKIITTHFSDCDFTDERHWLPGEGKIDWVELINTLEASGYSGPIMYELRLMPPANGSIKRRKLTFTDFKENHECLINKLPLKTIS